MADDADQVPRVAAVMAAELGRDPLGQNQQISRFEAVAKNYAV